MGDDDGGGARAQAAREDEADLRLVALMQEMAGDPRSPAVFTFADAFRTPLASAMRTHCAHHGLRRLAAEDLDGLVLDAAVELARCAAAWRPEGALPWVWARHRLSALARDHVGQWAESWDDERARERDQEEAVAPGAGPDDGTDRAMTDVLADLARRPDFVVVQLLEDALREVASDRDRTILLELEVQRVSGDPSPSQTVAAMTGLAPDAVRQVASRVRARLRRLAAREARYRDLAELPLLRSHEPSRSPRPAPRMPSRRAA